MKIIWFVPLLAACAKASDPCAGVTGACVSLTVISSTIHMDVDSLQLTASGAASGTQSTTATKAAPLPFSIAVRLGDKSGALHLDVIARNAGADLGRGMVDVTVAANAHVSATVDVESGGGGGDMGDDAGDAGDAGPDMPPICDPHGVNTPVCVWRWQTPLPVGEDIRGVYAFADDDTFALADSGAILHRDASAWSILPGRPKPTIGKFRALKLAGSPTDLYLLGYTAFPSGGSTTDVSEVFHSIDKGMTWTEEMFPPAATNNNNSLVDIAVNPSGDVIVAGGFSHVETRNHSSGAWADYLVDGACSGSGCSTNFLAITASVLANVAVYGPKGIYRGTSGTNIWTPYTGPNASSDIVSALCVGGSSPLRYWGVGYNGVITSSTDSTTWALQTSGVGAILYGCTAISNMAAWAFGQNGTIVSTTNGGTTWSGQTSGTSSGLLAASHSPANALTIAGQGGVILRTTNAGATYTNEQSGPSGGWISIFGLNPQNVYAAGNGGSIVHTTDGLTWQSIATTGTIANLIAIWASSPTDVYAVGQNGTLVHSTNGTSFTKYANPGSGGIPAVSTLYDVTGLGANNVFVAADTGLYRSTDGGTSFAPVTIPGYMGAPVTALFAMGGALWIGGPMGQIYRTTDGVAFASQTLTGIGASVPVTRIRGRLPSELYATSSAGAWLAHTTDGGMNWTNGLVPSLGAGAFDLAVTPSGSFVYASGNGLALSQDSGVNFVPVVTAPVPSAHVALYAPSDSEMFATDAGGIVHFGN